MFTLRVPMKVVDLQYAQTELEAVLLLPRPSSCSTISLLGENYRFFSKRFSFCLPCISWLVIQAAGLMGKLFLTHHSPMLGLAGGAMGSTDSSIPILWFWMHLPVKTRECQRERVPGRLSRLWQLTEGLSSALLNSAPQSHPLGTAAHPSHQKITEPDEVTTYSTGSRSWKRRRISPLQALALPLLPAYCSTYALCISVPALILPCVFFWMSG